MLSLTYEITTALSHTDELISPPYDIAIVTISYGRVTMSSVWDSMMSKKNMGWPFYAAVCIDKKYWWQLYLHEDTFQDSRVNFSNQGLFTKCGHIVNWFRPVLPFVMGLIVLVYGHSKRFPLDFNWDNNWFEFESSRIALSLTGTLLRLAWWGIKMAAMGGKFSKAE